MLYRVLFHYFNNFFSEYETWYEIAALPPQSYCVTIRNYEKIYNNFPFKLVIWANKYSKLSFLAGIMSLFPISKSGTLLRHSLNDKVGLMNQAPTYI